MPTGRIQRIEPISNSLSAGSGVACEVHSNVLTLTCLGQRPRVRIRSSRLLGGERVTGAAAAFGPTNQDALFDQLQDVTESGVL